MENFDMSDAFNATAVELVVTGNVATITLNGPEKRNAIGMVTAAALCGSIKEANDDPNVRVIVICGAGDCFSSGGDLKEFLAAADAPASEHWTTGQCWNELIRNIVCSPKPTIAKVKGAAIAGGCGIVAASDFAISSDTGFSAFLCSHVFHRIINLPMRKRVYCP